MFAVTKGAYGIQKKHALRAYATYLTSCVQHGASRWGSLWVSGPARSLRHVVSHYFWAWKPRLAQISPKLELDLQTTPSILARSFPTRALMRIECKYSKNPENH